MDEQKELIQIKTKKEVHNNIEIIISSLKTYIIVVAIDKDRIKNKISKISCKQGIPLGGYIYDSNSDNYIIECADYFHLGLIPVSFIGTIKGINHWKSYIPITESVIKKHLTTLQKKELKNFKNHFKIEEFDIQFIQMINCN